MKPRTRHLLEWLARSSAPVLESQIMGASLSSALNDALRNGYADMVAHPTVTDRSDFGGPRVPAAGVVLTPAGRAALDAA